MGDHPLRRWRIERELSGETLAKLLDTGKSTVSAIETGGRPPSRRLMRKIREVTGITADELLDAAAPREAAE